MQVKQIWVNLAVHDTKRTEKFYTDLGFKPNMHSATPELSSFRFAENDLIIHFFRKDKLESAMNDKAADLQNGSEVIFSLSAKSKEEVDQWAENVEKAGGSIIRKAGRQEDGYYYCVFADPDGHKFNALLIEDGM